MIYIISGECDHTLDGQAYPMKPGMMMRIPQGVKHKAANTGWAPVMMVICYSSADRQTVMCEEGQE
ncbi:TPA: cupin domain-containing protein [Candidatus Poribacteria bacterium]|nr:cupin domain-containing protein [Candidatus Poribacteria bacterium]